MRPNPKLDAEFYRKVNQQLHSKDKTIRALQQKLEEMQARVGSRAIDSSGHELELELSQLEAMILADAEVPEPTPPHVVAPSGLTHPAHDSALAMATAPVPVAETPAPHVPSPLIPHETTYHDVSPLPRGVMEQVPHAITLENLEITVERLEPDAPEPAAVASAPAPQPDRLSRKIAVLRPHLTDPTMDDGEVLHTALRLYDWFLRRQAQGYRVQLVNDEDSITEVDLIL